MKKILPFLFLLLSIFLQIDSANAQTGSFMRQNQNFDTLTLSSFDKKVASSDTFTHQNQNTYELAVRSKQSPIVVFPLHIRQDDTLIGNYAIADSNWMGKIVKIFAFYLPNGTKAAEAIIIGISKDNCSLQTFKDNEIRQVEVNVIDNTSRVQILAQYLVDNGYL